MTDAERADARRFRHRALVVAGVLLGVVLLVWLVIKLGNLITMIFVSFFLAIAFEPAVHFLEKRGWKRVAATAAVFVGALLLVVGFIAALAPLFVAQINQLIDALPGVVEGVITFLEDKLNLDLSEFDLSNLGQDIVGAINSMGGAIAGGLLSITASIGGFLVFATTVALFSFYMVAELPKLQRTILSFMPENLQRRAMHTWEVSVEKMGGYIYSRLILAIIASAVTAMALSLLKVPFSVPLGIWVGFLSQFIPVVGTYIAAVLPAVVALTFRGTGTAAVVVVILVLYQQVENYFLAPYITSRTMEIHPAVSLGAIIAGGALLGGLGVILALPVTGIIQAIIAESRRPYDVILDSHGGGDSGAAAPEPSPP